MWEPTILERQLVSELQTRIYDHHVRLVYADWLEQRGDTDRATVLRFDAGVYGWSPSVDSAIARVDVTWRAAIDPRAARRDPLWLAAALNGEPERSLLGELAPPRFGEPGTTQSGVLDGWPDALLARIAAAAARFAIDGAREVITPDNATQCERLLERTLAQRPVGEVDLGWVLRDAMELRVGVGYSQAQWSAFESLACALRACGAPVFANDRRLADAASRALATATTARVAVAWTIDGLDKQHAHVRSLARHARRAAQRARQWREHSRRAAKRKADIATASLHAQAAYQSARASCPPAPSREAIAREVAEHAAAQALAWLRATA